jgi:ceramide glucosyltransferase
LGSLQILLYAGLGVAVVGTLSSGVFLVLTLLGVLKFRAETCKMIGTPPDKAHLPPASVLKPVHGLEARLRENIESFFRQDYPRYEVLIAADGPDNAALPVVREVCARYPQIASRIVITGEPQWLNPPAFAFQQMAEAAAYDILVTSDSDVEVAPNYLQEVVPPLLDPKVGMVTCLYRGKNAAGFWSLLTSIGMSVEMSAGVLVANLLEGMKFGLGPTIVVRKDSVERIGGYRVLRDYFANDFVIGNLIDKAGYRVLLSGNIIEHIVDHPTFRRMWENQLRWAKSTRYSRPKGHFGSGLIYAMPFGILGFVTAALLGHTAFGAMLLGAAILNRVIEAWVVGWKVVRDPVARWMPWLYPLRDLLGFAVWCGSYSSPTTVWRDKTYNLEGERIGARQRH